jgi:pectate lyase
MRAIAGLFLVILAPAGFAAGLTNLSARGFTGAGGETLTAGFVVAGESPKRLLVRGAGPALTGLGVPAAVGQLRLDLFRNNTLIATNDRWDGGADAAAVGQVTQSVGAFAFPAGSRDAALLLMLEPGNYTAQVVPTGPATGGGTTLVEIYDVEPGAANSRLANLSARARAGTGSDTFIVGFFVAGDTRNRVLVRGIGPGLGAFGVGGALGDPQVEVFRDGESVAFNDDWSANTNAAQLIEVSRGTGAFALGGASRDAALLLPGASGAYTAHCTAATGGGGVALIEIYDSAGAAPLPPARSFDLIGFGRVSGDGLAAVTGGGTPSVDYNPVTRTGNFWRIDDATVAAAGAGFAAQLQTALASDQPLVIELNTMLDLSRHGRTAGATAIAHPDLLTPGRTTGTVGALSLGSNKTIYSAYGNGGFRRGSLSIAGKNNIVLRNLKFRELWEWDDATAGEYDRNDWDYLAIASLTSGAAVTARAHHIWIDHCDFEKSYDGLFDIVHGANLVTVSWCKIAGAVSGESRRWVQRQMDYLEANRTRFPYYHAQRFRYSAEEILAEELFQKKGNLIGNSTDAATAAHDIGYLNVTLHHNWYVSVDQRMPRLRFGNAHVFNLLAESTAGNGVAGLSQMAVAATSNGAMRVEGAQFVDVRAPVTISAGTEPVGRITVLNSVNVDSATRTDRGFDAARVSPVALFQWNQPAAATGIRDWPQLNTAVMPAGYVPAGRALAEYLDPQSFLPTHLAEVGVIAPADAVQAEQLRRWLQTTTASR